MINPKMVQLIKVEDRMIKVVQIRKVKLRFDLEKDFMMIFFIFPKNKVGIRAPYSAPMEP